MRLDDGPAGAEVLRRSRRSVKGHIRGRTYPKETLNFQVSSVRNKCLALFKDGGAALLTVLLSCVSQRSAL